MALTSDSIGPTYPNSRINNKAAFNAMTWTASNDNFIADANDKPVPVKGVMVTVAGNLNLVFMDQTVDQAVVVPVSANVVYPFAIKQIRSTFTTATGIIVFY